MNIFLFSQLNIHYRNSKIIKYKARQDWTKSYIDEQVTPKSCIAPKQILKIGEMRKPKRRSKNSQCFFNRNSKKTTEKYKKTKQQKTSLKFRIRSLPSQNWSTICHAVPACWYWYELHVIILAASTKVKNYYHYHSISNACNFYWSTRTLSIFMCH